MYPVSAVLETERRLLDSSLLSWCQHKSTVLLHVHRLTLGGFHWFGCAHYFPFS
jgi:hypothetical protein